MDITSPTGGPDDHAFSSEPRVVPATFAQQRLWFLDQLQPASIAYLIAWSVPLHGPLDVGALQRSLEELINRHEVLKGTFVQNDGEVCMVIPENVRFPLRVVEVNGPEDVRRIAEKESHTPINLETGPMVRATLLRAPLVGTAPWEHTLLLTLHHISFDGSSRAIFVRELQALYNALQSDNDSPLQPPQLQYSDYADWQRRSLQGKRYQKLLGYWKKQLADLPDALSLPTDKSRPAIETFRGGRKAFELPGALSAGLADLARQRRCSLFMVSLTAFQILLAKYSGQDDIVVGSPVAGRERPELEGLVGLLANEVALRLKLNPGATFLSLLAQARDVCLGAFEHQDMPFEKLVLELNPERSLSRNPLFQVLFSLTTGLGGGLQLDGLDPTAIVSAAAEFAKFDLSLYLRDDAGTDDARAISGWFEYNTDLFDVATVERMAGHYRTLLEAIVERPDAPVSELSLLTEMERRQLLVEFNDTARVYPTHFCLHDLVTQQATRTPEVTAIACGGERISYRELNARANRVAHYLLRRGAGPEVLIGLCCERNIPMLVGMLGILKAGSAYVPVDPRYPKERIGVILSDAQTPVVLTQSSVLGELAGFSGEVICLDEDWPKIAGEVEDEPASGVKPENLAYVLFTSGSTGRPKGVALGHRGVATFVHWAREVFSPEQLSGVLLSTSVCFDLSIFEIFVTLSAGGKIIVAENALHLPGLQERDEVTLINTVPSAMAELVRMGGVPASVETVNLAGEALADSLVEQIYAATGVKQVYNLYGPTEDTTYSTYTLVSRGTPVTIGRPVANTQAYILDEGLRLAPIGVPGQLYLAGDGLARGYYGRADLTEERFVANPYRTAGRMYRTGDLCKWRADGIIQYLGRADYQVKLRGFRIELGEIEAVLNRHPAIRQSLATVLDTDGFQRLVAWVTPESGATVDTETLRAHAQQFLPDFMVPVAILTLPAFPLTPNGKVDRKALPIPEFGAANEGECEPVRTPAEGVVAEIWADVLRRESVGANQNFFELGGHSLLATQVIARISRAFKIRMPLRAMFETPTVAGLAKQAETLQTGENAAESLPLKPVDCSGPLPLSFAQQRLWFLNELDPANPLYNITFALHLTGDLHSTHLREALDEVVCRHEALRTRFASQDGEPVQIVCPPSSPEFSLLTAGDQDEARRLIRLEALRPFDLREAPLIRAALITLAPHDHILALFTHHIVSDGWSSGVIVEDLRSLYASLVEGKPSHLPGPSLQYADYAVWQRQHLSGETLNAQLAWWKQQLAGAPAALELPTDHPRPPVETFRGAKQTISLPASLLDDLRKLSRTENATLFMTLLSAFSILLSRYSGQEEVVIGSPVAGRNRAETEQIVGLFLNTVVLRVNLVGNPALRELLGRVRETALGAYARQDVPFEKLVAEVAPERDFSRNPLFQAMLMLQNLPSVEPDFGGVSSQPFQVGNPTSKFDLTLIAIEQPDGLRVTMEYSTDLFEASTIARMLNHFGVLLRGIIAKPEQPVLKLPLLDSAERKEALFAWNATAREYPRDLCLHQWIELQSERTPERIAVSSGNEQLSYRQLNGRANQVARGLMRQGAASGTRVAIRMARSVNMLAGLLGILKSGAAYIPLDPHFPEERIDFILGDSEARLVLDDRNWERFDVESADNPDIVLSADAPAYVLHTSGSTGKPKGVEITHRNLVNFLASMECEPSLRADDILLAVTTLSFDIAGLELYLPLTVGAQVVIASREESSDANRLIRLMESSGATVLQATPATWRMLLDSGWAGSKTLKALCGGEALPAALAQQLLPRCGELWNMYGPTETTIWSSVFRIESDFGGNAPLGRPIANTTMYVLDSQNEPVPAGVTGELYIGGDGVASGYWKRPELTVEKFLADPFVPGARMYRTGDLARYDSSGIIHYLGRADFQVKVRGFRIELGEVESVLARHEAVRECVAIASEAQLAAYVTLHHPASSQALRDYLRASVPDYMVPSAIVVMDALPLTPNGKVDRKALSAMEIHGEVSEGYVEPRTPTEIAVAAIWADVLLAPQVGAADDFFELGGHSLLATRVISRAQQIFEIELPLRALFEHHTVAAFAAFVDEAARERTGNLLPPIRPIPRDGRIPLSFAQQRLWFLNELEPANSIYNVPCIVRLRGSLDLSALQESVNEIVRRHEALRTRFGTMSGGEPVQIVDPWQFAPITRIALSDCEGELREKELLRITEEQTFLPFDLSAGPLFRAVLIEAAPDDHVLLLNMHHIVSDAWSVAVIRREVSALYQSFLGGGSSPLEDPAIQYADYAVWQREVLADDRFEKQMGYWREQLREAPTAIELPTDRPRPVAQTYAGAQKTVVFPKSLLSALKELSNREGVTLFMTLLAAAQVLHSRYTGEDDIVIGTPVAGRTRMETENLVGFFVNTLVLRTSLHGNPSFGEVLRRVKETTLGAYAHQDIPFEKLVEELRPDRSSNRTPLFQVVVALQNAPADQWALPGLTASPFPIGWPHAKFDLMFLASEKPEGLRMSVEYNTGIFDEQTILRITGHLRVLLEAVTADSSGLIGALPILTPKEQKQLLIDWNDTQRDYPQLCIHEIFEQQAARNPDAVAVAFRDSTLTYGELNEQSGRLANHLRALGVTTESRVGIFMERSPEMIVGLLGILKAGGGYVPLEPNYPSERLNFLIHNSELQTVVTVGSMAGRLPSDVRNTVLLDGVLLDGEWPVAPLSSTRDRQRPDSLAYVLYTSGSTGEPKGVETPHCAVVRLVFEANYARFSNREVILQAATLSFDASTFEIWGALLHGGKLVIFPERVPTTGMLKHVIAVNGVSTLWLTASLFNWVIDEDPQILSPARQILTGGEALSVPHIRKALDALPETTLINGYGPTETTTFAVCYRIPRDQDSGAASIPIGKPISNTTVYILDRQGQLVPIGVPGELYIGGPGLARGYLGQPESTAQRFVSASFSPVAAERLYATGDLVRWLADGNIEFLGRRDSQVKIRGFRIEPGEIEAMLGRNPEVRDCAVIVREDMPGDKRIVAYVLAAGRGKLSTAEIRAWLKDRVPEFLVPAAIVQMDAFPLSASGKVNRKALPVPVYGTADREWLAPRTPVEEIVSEIWADVLKLERIGTNENFFELGGHSLLGARVISRIRESFGFDVPLRALFDSPTVVSLGKTIEDLQHAEDGSLAPRLVPVPRDGGLPLSFAQERLWFIDQLNPLSTLYNVSIALRLTGELDRRALEGALHSLVDRHEILRTVYRTENERSVQYFLRNWSIPLNFQAVSDKEEVKRVLETESARPFHLDEDLMLRALLIEIGPCEHVLLLSTHHIATDGWSNGVLKNDLMSFYNAAVQAESASLPELQVQYADYAVWQRDWLQGDVLEKQLVYWRRQLTGAPPVLKLPLDRPRPAAPSYRGGVERVVLSSELTNAARAVGRAAGATSFMTLLAAFQILMAYYTRQTDIVLGTDLANRNDIRLEGIAGFFVNLLVLRADLSGNPSFAEFLQRVRNISLGAYSHSDVPFEKLVEELQPERSLGWNPLVQALFVQQNLPRSTFAMRGLEVSGFPLPVDSKFDMAVFVTEGAEGTICNWVYSTDLFEAATIVKMGNLYRVILSEVSANPDLKMNDLLQRLAESERESRAAEHKEFRELSTQKLKNIRRRVGV